MKTTLIIFFAFLLLLGYGCSYLQIRGSFHGGVDDWRMYGGSIGRTNVAAEVLMPPLTKMWEYDASAGFSPYSATGADHLLFIGNLQGEVHAVDARSGKGKGVHDFGTAVVGAPVIDADELYVTLANEEESFVAYNLERGAVDWTDNLGAIESSPLIIDQKLYVTSLRGKLTCVDKSNGSMPWTYAIPKSRRTTMIHSSPASDGNTIVFGCDNGDLYAVDLHSGNLRWTANTNEAILASPSVSDGRVFVGSLDKKFYAFDLETGTQIWQQALDAKIYSSQAVDERHVIVGTSGRSLYCLNKSNGEILWKYAANSLFNAAPLISGTIVYAGCIDKNLYAFDIETGKVLWQYKAEGRIKSMPVIWQQQLFLLAEDHTVLSFRSERWR